MPVGSWKPLSTLLPLLALSDQHLDLSLIFLGLDSKTRRYGQQTFRNVVPSLECLAWKHQGEWFHCPTKFLWRLTSSNMTENLLGFDVHDVVTFDVWPVCALVQMYFYIWFSLKPLCMYYVCLGVFLTHMMNLYNDQCWADWTIVRM